MPRINESVIGRIGAIEHWEAFRVCFPWELAAVNNNATESCSMPSHKLRQRVNHNIGPISDRAQKNGSCDSVVHNQGNAVVMGDLSQCLKIADITSRISHALTEDCARLVVNQPLYR